MNEYITQFKTKLWSVKKQTMTLIGILASLIAVYTFGMEWYNDYQEQRFKSDFDEAITQGSWGEYDQILKSVNSKKQLRDMYLFYAGYRELNKERSFSITPNPEFYLKQIDPLSEYFSRSILFRLTWINKKFKDEELIRSFTQLRNELETSGYFGPFYHLNEYLILKNSNFVGVDESYKKFLSTYDFIKENSYSVPVEVNKNEGLINLTVYHQIAALNYLFLTNMIRYSDQKKEVNLAYRELSRLYATQSALETTIIGLIELNLGTPEQLKGTIQMEALDFMGIEVDFKRFLTNAMNEWGFVGQDIIVGIGKSATSNKFKSRRGYVRDERLVLSNPHSS